MVARPKRLHGELSGLFKVQSCNITTYKFNNHQHLLQIDSMPTDVGFQSFISIVYGCKT